jgi:hypothetical protein
MRATPGIPDREFGDGVHDFLYLPVTNPATGKTWLNNNLGASYANVNHPNFNPAQQATSLTDDKAYGSMYQWGRYSDGHELVKRNTGDPHATSGVTTSLSNSNTPPHDDFINVSSNTNSDWRSPRNDNLWLGVNGINNPCPLGYRLPTTSESAAEFQTMNPINHFGAFQSILKLPASGWRNSDGNPTIQQVGSWSEYWLSGVDGIQAWAFNMTSNTIGNDFDPRGYGYAVRCIKD